MQPLHYQRTYEEIEKFLDEATAKIDDPIEKIYYRIDYWNKLLDPESEKWAAANKSRKTELEGRKRQKAEELAASAELLEKAEKVLKQLKEEKKISQKLNQIFKKIFKMGKLIVK